MGGKNAWAQLEILIAGRSKQTFGKETDYRNNTNNKLALTNPHKHEARVHLLKVVSVKSLRRAGEKAQMLEALTALPKDLNSASKGTYTQSAHTPSPMHRHNLKL